MCDMGASLAAMVARGSFNTVSGTASCHYSMQECWSFPRPRTLNSCGTTAKWRHGSRPPAPSQSSNRRPWFPRNRTEGLSTRGGAVPAVASPASVAARGRVHIQYADGCTSEFVAPQVVAIEPGHDGWVVGDEPAVLVEFDFEGETVSRLGMPEAHQHR